MPPTEALQTSDATMKWSSIEDDIKSALQEIEKERIPVLKEAAKDILRYGLPLSVVVYVLATIYEFFEVKAYGFSIYLAVAALIATIVYFSWEAYSKMKGLYMEKIMPLLMRPLTTNEKDTVRRTDKTTPFYQLVKRNLFNNGLNKVNIKVDDCMMGKTGDTRFNFGEAEFTNAYDHSRFGRWFKDRLLFKGIVFTATFNKEFKGNVFVSTRRRWRTMGRNPFFRSIMTEDISFNKAFHVSTTDEQQAFYVLSTSLIEKLTQLHAHVRQTIHERHMVVYFAGHQIIILIPTLRDRFEPGMLRPLTINSIRDDFFTLNIMLTLVDELNLNTRIWTKQ